MKPTPIKPELGQESVWDYPRPPRLEQTGKHIEVIFNNVVITGSEHAWRVLETSHPPVYYIPPNDVAMEHLTQSPGQSFCEWKGRAGYYDVAIGGRRVL